MPLHLGFEEAVKKKEELNPKNYIKRISLTSSVSSWHAFELPQTQAC